MDKLQSILSEMSTISLEEMKQVKLMNRVDTKFMISIRQLEDVFDKIKADYYIQAINDILVATYQTLYYDTPDLAMYIAHQNKKLNRQKIRTRQYCDTANAFCEIKNKNNKGRTKKVRIPIDLKYFGEFEDDKEALSFAEQNLKYLVSDLLPQVETNFKRITIVNFDKTERITIDSGLYFKNEQNGVIAEVPELVIIEVKQGMAAKSLFINALHDLHIQPQSISKYCLGMVLTNSAVKHNRFKKKIQYIKKFVTNKIIIS